MNVMVTMIENEIREAISDYVFKKYGLKVSPANLGVQTNTGTGWQNADIRVSAECSAIAQPRYES